MNRANEDTEEEVQALKGQIEQLKKAPQASVSANVSSEDTKRLQRELTEKDEKVYPIPSPTAFIHSLFMCVRKSSIQINTFINIY